jgi:hypothetical protein
MRFRRRSELEDINLLEITPVRTADWEEVGGRVVVLRPTPRPRGLKTALDWLFYLMAVRKIRLDEIGSFTWHQLDGKQTVSEVARKLGAEFGGRVEPAEERLGRLVRAFRREELVGYRHWDESAERSEPARCVQVRQADPPPTCST